MLRYLARPAVLAVAALLLALSACRVTDMAIWSPTDRLGAEPCAVTVIRDIVYRPGPEKDEYRRRLDLYLPAGQHDFPVVVLVHGGCWLLGDNRCCGLYSSVGQFLASAGIGAVLPNYRLSPGVKHPAHIQDVAKAVAWTKQHIAEYGGRPAPLFLVGHSA
ncbi:MAG TPA: alpha/beta hydrolase, partial [Gemmataceae bacterium]|nr:alpha/beta hydrolase [Gemmataceae bacterium]